MDPPVAEPTDPRAAAGPLTARLRPGAEEVPIDRRQGVVAVDICLRLRVVRATGHRPHRAVEDIGRRRLQVAVLLYITPVRPPWPVPPPV